MCHRVEIVAPEPNVSVEILRGPDGSEFSHWLRVKLACATKQGRIAFTRRHLTYVAST
jgi:hypothetical protein